MTTSLVARESTLPPPKLPTSDDLLSIIEQFISDDELRRQLDVEPAIVTISHSFHTTPAMGDLATMPALPSARHSRPFQNLVIYQSEPRFRFFTHALATSHTTDTLFFNVTGNEDNKSLFFPVCPAENPRATALRGLDRVLRSD